MACWSQPAGYRTRPAKSCASCAGGDRPGTGRRRPIPRIVALRGYNTATLYIKRNPFNAEELAALREFAAQRAFDLVYAPDLRLEEANRYNVLPEPVYYQSFNALLRANPRQAFYAAYPFEVSPPTDDRPFFGHFFKWSQTGQVLAELGKSWQPFGGAGYFVILALLALAVLSSAVVVMLPVAATRLARRRRVFSRSQKTPVPGLLAALEGVSA
jgi:hypothetical protein